MYTQAMQMVFCQKTVMGLFLFHVQDEAALAAWQSGEYYVDGTPKASLPADRRRRGDRAPRRRRVVPGPAADAEARRPGIEAERRRVRRSQLTCSLDCTYTVSLDRRRLTGTAVGRVATTLVFKGALAAGAARRRRARSAAPERRAARVGPALVLLALTRDAHRVRRRTSGS